MSLTFALVYVHCYTDWKVSRSLELYWARRGKIQLIWNKGRVTKVGATTLSPCWGAKIILKASMGEQWVLLSQLWGAALQKSSKTERRKGKTLGTSMCCPVWSTLCNYGYKVGRVTGTPARRLIHRCNVYSWHSYHFCSCYWLDGCDFDHRSTEIFLWIWVLATDYAVEVCDVGWLDRQLNGIIDNALIYYLLPIVCHYWWSLVHSLIFSDHL